MEKRNFLLTRNYLTVRENFKGEIFIFNGEIIIFNGEIIFSNGEILLNGECCRNYRDVLIMKKNDKKFALLNLIHYICN